MSSRQKIFVSAYACEPNQGSEIGVGWHWVVEMAKYFDVWVLTRQSNRENIERYLSENPLERTPTFIYYDLPKRWRFWKRGLRGVRLYYILWQRLSNGLVSETMEREKIELFHHLTYGNALWSVSRYGQKQRFIWGPTSVGNSMSREFSKHYGFKSRVKEWAQRFIASTLRYNRGFKSRCRDASLILCKTEQSRQLIPAEYRGKAIVFTDVAVETIAVESFESSPRDERVRYLAVGRLEGWRGFDILIEAFARALNHNPKLHLDILGKGVDKQRLMALIDGGKLQGNISLRGQVSREEYYQYMASCDVVVNPTLKEGAVTAAFDSLSFAKPLICIDTGGYTKYFSSDYASVLELDERESLIEKLSHEILRFASRELRETLRESIIQKRDSFSWECKGEQIYRVIRESQDE